MKYIFTLWIFAMNPLGSAEIDYSVIIGMPKANVACQYEIENNDCSPMVLSRERIRRKK